MRVRRDVRTRRAEEAHLTVDEEVYEGLHRVLGRGQISRFLNDLARPHVVQDEFEEAYREMAADEEREREALEISEGVIGDVADELA